MGSLAHADDLRSLTLDPQSSKQQADIIDDFLAKNFLQLNTKLTNVSWLFMHTVPNRTPSQLMWVIYPWSHPMLPSVWGHGGLQILVQRKQSWRISVVPVERSSHLGALEFFMVI